MTNLKIKEGTEGVPITVSWELITPDRAIELTQTMKRNRRVRKDHINSLRDKYINREWLTRAAFPIRIDKDGSLIDGLHRLTALIKAQESRYFLILRGYEPDDFSFLDEGARRTKSDTAYIMGEKDPAAMSSTIVAIRKVTDQAKPFSNPQYTDFRNAHPRIIESVEFGRKVFDSIDLPIGVCGALHYMYTGLGYQSEFENFISDACAFNYSENKKAISYLLRDKVKKIKTNNAARTSITVYLFRQYITHIAYAFDEHLKGTKITNLNLGRKALTKKNEEIKTRMLEAIENMKEINNG